jgi:hypothetical protein
VDEEVYEGRLRWGGDQEAFWGDFFNGAKRVNRWADSVPQERPAAERSRIEIFGFTIGGPDDSHLRRLFMARFGDIARVETRFREVDVTLKSGALVTLDRWEAGDIDDGVRVWDASRGVVDLDTKQIRTIDFLPTPPLADAPRRLHGVGRTRQGDFTGFIQWDQQDGAGSDTLDARSGDDRMSLRFDTVRSIARHSRDSALVTLADGRELVLSGGREVGRNNRGIYVDDARYGRVLVLWETLERVEFEAAGTGPAYGDFPPGQPLAGIVLTRDGRRLAGRLVYDLDESETIETLDVSSSGVDYAIPFGLIVSLVPPGRQGGDGEPGKVALRGGEDLHVERSGDLGDQNAGMLVFTDGREEAEYVPWIEIERIDFDDPAGAPR